ncbi:HD-GYP domain-containing protein [Desulfotruncus arcticus]|nr:HD-GYP domain-containing protein [Desulfotruncus arcticus]
MRPLSLDGKSLVTLGIVFSLAILMIYGTWSSIIATGIGSAVADIIGKRGWQKVIFNSSQYSISLLAAGTIYAKLSPVTDEVFSISHHIIPFVFTATAFVVVNILLVAVIVSLSLKIALLDVIKMDEGMVTLFLISLAPLSLLLVVLYTSEPYSVILILPPLALAYVGFENYLKLSRQTRITFEHLAGIVDRRDNYTSMHSARVAAYAEQIAYAMGLSYGQVENLSMAGRVHDLGKIGVRDSVLLKPGALTDSEFEEMKKHTEIGYYILQPLEMYKEVLANVLYHHERVDGKGYPCGLKYDAIPLGARILAVADSFDAMTSDRLYRKAMSEEQAVQELIDNQGTQFDPQVVEAFIKAWKKEKNTGRDN